MPTGFDPRRSPSVKGASLLLRVSAVGARELGFLSPLGPDLNVFAELSCFADERFKLTETVFESE